MNKFKLVSKFKPTGDQPEAIEKLVKGIRKSYKDQVLLGVTGSGKTFTIANVIARLNLPTLVISHNKTLAGQLYQEFRDFFPKNAVSYFVSYYDYYQPEAYIPQTDTYIEKETAINEEIDKLRLRATANILTRKDTLIVASVSCIYNIGSAKEYGNFVIELVKGEKINRERVLKELVNLQYTRAGYDFTRGTFRVRGEIIDIFASYSDTAFRICLADETIEEIIEIDPLTTKNLSRKENVVIYPAKHYMMNPSKMGGAFKKIKGDLEAQVDKFKGRRKFIEAQRIYQRVNYDLEMIKELGYVNGIENYSRYFDGRNPGDPPYSLIDYFQYKYKNNWLLVIDESHMSIPQIRGMYRGDLARKKTLIEFGFRLPAAIDNRPLKFDEFLRKRPSTVYVSATPAEWEKTNSKQIVEQLIRPTGLIDPKIQIRPTKGQIPDLITEVLIRKERGERVLVTTLTKKMAEELTNYLNSPKEMIRLSLKKIPKGSAFTDSPPRVQYLHADVETLDRQDVLDDLRMGRFDVVVGINLLREGLDLPEVSLVAILDADKEGFLRSQTSLIQTMGRAARHINGKVIMYADEITKSMRLAIEEVARRRKVQVSYNKRHKISPKTIAKPIRKKLVKRKDKNQELRTRNQVLFMGKRIDGIDVNQLVPADRDRLIKKLEKEMRKAARELDFERAAYLRDKVGKIKNNLTI
jgi:excinuclease ABC subunit B